MVKITLNTGAGGMSIWSDFKIKVIVHEMGHALKLAHPNQNLGIATVNNGRGGYINQEKVCSIMNQNDPTINNLTCGLPKRHDIINLKNKWGN